MTKGRGCRKDGDARGEDACTGREPQRDAAQVGGRGADGDRVHGAAAEDCTADVGEVLGRREGEVAPEEEVAEGVACGNVLGGAGCGWMVSGKGTAHLRTRRRGCLRVRRAPRLVVVRGWLGRVEWADTPVGSVMCRMYGAEDIAGV